MQVTKATIWLGTAISAFTVLGGGAVSRAVADWDAAYIAWSIGTVWFIIRSLVSIILWQKQRISTRFSIYCGVLLGLDLTSFMLALGLPVFFIVPAWSLAGGGLVAIWGYIMYKHLLLAEIHFRQRWRERSKEVLDKTIKENDIDLDKLSNILRLEPQNLSNHKNEKLSFVLKGGLITLMLLGLNFRKQFPELSAIAWSFPALFIASILLQYVIMGISLAREVGILERNRGIPLRPSL